MFDASLALLDRVHNKVIQCATSCGHSYIVLVVNDAEITETTVEAFDASLGLELVQAGKDSVLRLVGGEGSLSLVGLLAGIGQLGAQLLRTDFSGLQLGFSLRQFLLRLGVLFLKGLVVFLRRLIGIADRLKCFLRLVEGLLSGRGLLCKEVAFRLSNVDGRLLVADLGSPGLQLTLLDLNLGGKLVRLV